MSGNHWNEYHRRWSQLQAPLRPNDEIVAAFKRAIAEHAECVLLLGVTPELADLGRDTIAVDRNENMIAHIWPGDTERRRAVQGEWSSLPLEPQSVSAAIGDGSLSALAFPDEQGRLLGELARVVKPGGVVALRVFATPEQGETPAQVRAAALAGQIRSFHAFKWRVAMALATQQNDPNVKVADILSAVDGLFPDREGLFAATGWPREDIATIDVYRGSREIYGFPTLTQLRDLSDSLFASMSSLASGTYPLAERCPIVVLDARA